MPEPTQTVEELKWEVTVLERRLKDYERLVERAKEQLQDAVAKLALVQERRRQAVLDKDTSRKLQTDH